MIEPDLDYTADIETLLFLENLARQINSDMQLGLSVPVMRRVAMRVLDAEPEGAEELHRTLGGLLLRERMVH